MFIENINKWHYFFSLYGWWSEKQLHSEARTFGWFVFYSCIICALIRSDQLLSRVRLFATPRTIQSMEFSRPEYRSG